MSINLKHSTTGLVKECPEGFSWTSFFFNGFVPLFRGMWGAFAITFFTGGLAGLYYMFAINKLYVVHLLEKGYTPVSDVDIDKIKAMGVSIASESHHTKAEIEAPTESVA